MPVKDWRVVVYRKAMVTGSQRQPEISQLYFYFPFYMLTFTFLVRGWEGNEFNEPYTQEAFSEGRRCDLEYCRHRAPVGAVGVQTRTLQCDTMSFGLPRAHISFIWQKQNNDSSLHMLIANCSLTSNTVIMLTCFIARMALHRNTAFHC
jgi:hypothetical protein